MPYFKSRRSSYVRRRRYRASGFRRGTRYAGRFRRSRRVGRFYPRRRFYNRGTICKVPGVVLPPKAFIKFRFFSVYTLNASTSSPSDRSLAFYINNPYDPVVGVSTSTCTGYTTIMGMYQHCICLAAKIHVSFYPISTVYPCFGYLAAFASQDSNLLGTEPTRDVLSELHGRYSVRRLLNANVQSDRLRKLHKFVTIRKLEGLTRLDPTAYQSTSSSGPSRLCYAVLGIRNMTDDSSTEATTHKVFVNITYYCKVLDRADFSI